MALPRYLSPFLRWRFGALSTSGASDERFAAPERRRIISAWLARSGQPRGAAFPYRGRRGAERSVCGAPLAIQVTHRIIAFLLLGHLIGVAIGVRKRAEPRPIRVAAWTALGIVTLQIVVAAAMVEMHLPASLRSIHQAIGTALWISVAALVALASGLRYMTDIERIVYESPSRGKFATPEGVST